jgi:phosphohistidine phosphatase
VTGSAQAPNHRFWAVALQVFSLVISIIMNLILWRHAEADEANEKPGSERDMKRKLTKGGRAQAKRMADWLLPHLPQHAVVLSSPALRAQETAAALNRPFETADQLSPTAGVEQVLSLADWPHGYGERNAVIVLVGHQPTLGAVAALLLADQLGSWSIRKGAMWWISNRDRDGTQQNILRAALSPDLVED